MKIKIFLLTLDTFSSTGGIQNVCRNLCFALKSFTKDDAEHSFKMYSLYDETPDEKYISSPQFKAFKHNKIYFTIQAIMRGINSEVIIISHINLLFIARCIKLFAKKTEIIMIAHGVEVWRAIKPWKRIFIQKHVKIWAVSNFTSQTIQTRHHTHHRNITVLHNSLGPFFNIPQQFSKPAQLLNKYGLSESHQILISITRLNKYETDKGCKSVIAIFPELLKEFPNLQYLICGHKEPHERKRLQRLIMRNNLQRNIKLIDFIPDHELTAHYLLADIFILPSKKEGFGLVFIEAAACGCKVISGNADGSTDAMLNGKLGTMVNPDCKIELTAAILHNLRQKRNHQTALKTQLLCLNNFGYKIYEEKVKQLLMAKDKSI